MLFVALAGHVAVAVAVCSVVVCRVELVRLVVGCSMDLDDCNNMIHWRGFSNKPFMARWPVSESDEQSVFGVSLELKTQRPPDSFHYAMRVHMK